ncbi:TetR/AcrR family transcriptional regulator [Montanilutibacter psychrotolerans]|uniref:TetR/AcrR family transcriptional regulator n=1 Tax=Montanilutibacter psychrotolerans TaxID=1327343 RepID=A0A3M8SN21_9GAMM|nr:TetR/AcrR family transcriptional regulator [Lysobacter psychrotolerans]RNF82045.1 TetR/AcrR family transcriptional regulator [Lysobacter psychrotolerans]
MPAPLLSREAVVDRLLGAFRRYGYDAASLGQLSDATGLGRSSLYHYFPGGKEGMARAVLDRVDEWAREAILAPALASGTPERRLSQVIAALDSYYGGGAEACLLGNLVVGDARALFQDRLIASLRTLIECLARLAREKGVSEREAQQRAEDAVVRIQGALIVARGLADPAPFRRVLKRLPQDLLG